MRFECRPERPWGIHPVVHSDQECPRCGWTAPGPIGDAIAAVEEAMVQAGAVAWDVLDPCVPEGDEAGALAA